MFGTNTVDRWPSGIGRLKRSPLTSLTDGNSIRNDPHPGCRPVVNIPWTVLTPCGLYVMLQIALAGTITNLLLCMTLIVRVRDLLETA